MKLGRGWWGNPLFREKFLDAQEGSGVVDAIRNRGGIDLLDPSTLLDGLNLGSRLIPGFKLPIPIGRKSEGDFDWLAPVPNSPGQFDDRKDYKSPFDCKRWPDSPFCKNPLEQLDHKPIGIQVEIAYTDCEVCIKATYDFAFFRFPLYTRCFRKPTCIKDEIPEDPPLPAPSPPLKGEAPPCRGCKPLPSNFESSLWGAYRVVRYKPITYSMPDCPLPGPFTAYDTEGSYYGSGLYTALPIPLEEIAAFNWGSPDNQEKYNYRLYTGTYGQLSAKNSYWWSITIPLIGRFRKPTQREREQSSTPLPPIIWDGYDPTNFHYVEQYFYTPARSKVELFSSGRWTFLVGKAGEFDTSPYVDYLGYVNECLPKGNPLEPYAIGPGLLWTDSPQKRPLPPPPAPHDKSMDCCSDLDEKLDYIIQKLGLKIYPLVVQKDLTKAEDKELDPNSKNEDAQKLSEEALQERGLVKLEDMTNFLAWQSVNTFKTLGDYPFEVVAQSDENSEERASFNNMREAVTFLSTKLITTGMDADNIWSAIQLVLFETAQQKAALQKTVDLLLAISQAIGFQLESESKEITIPFTLPNGESAEEIAAKVDTYPVADLLKPRVMKVASFRAENQSLTVFKTLGQIEKAAKIAAAAATETGREPDASDVLNRLSTLVDRLLGKRSSEESQKEDSKWDDALKVLELNLNQYFKANGVPEIKIRSTEQREETPPQNPSP